MTTFPTCAAELLALPALYLIQSPPESPGRRAPILCVAEGGVLCLAAWTTKMLALEHFVDSIGPSDTHRLDDNTSFAHVIVVTVEGKDIPSIRSHLANMCGIDHFLLLGPSDQKLLLPFCEFCPGAPVPPSITPAQTEAARKIARGPGFWLLTNSAIPNAIYRPVHAPDGRQCTALYTSLDSANAAIAALPEGTRHGARPQVALMPDSDRRNAILSALMNLDVDSPYVSIDGSDPIPVAAILGECAPD